MAAHSDDELQRIKVEIPDGYSFRTIIDILRETRDNFHFRFKPNNIEIAECCTGQKTTMHFYIYGDNLLEYVYPLRDERDIPWPIYAVKVQAQEIFAVAQNDNKKEIISMYMDVHPVKLTNDGLFFVRGKGATSLKMVNRVKASIGSIIPPTEIIDYYETEYKDREPSSKVITINLVNRIKSIRNCKCNSIHFELSNTGTVSVKGKIDNETVSGFQLPKSGSDAIDIQEESESEYEENSDDEDDEEAKVVTTDVIHIIRMKIGSFKWFTKTARLANSSIAKIYLKRGKPLVIRLCLGLYGFANFTFTSDV